MIVPLLIHRPGVAPAVAARRDQLGFRQRDSALDERKSRCGLALRRQPWSEAWEAELGAALVGDDGLGVNLRKMGTPNNA